jgi:hypothetical protein
MERQCRVCPVFKQQPAHYEQPYVCDHCRARLARALVQIADQWLLLDATPGGSRRERVSGSAEAPLGARVDVLDQMLPVGPHADQAIRANIADQIGEPSAGVVLDLIAAEWLDARRRDGHREHRPIPTVANLTAWLRDRLDWACTYLPDSIGDHADELRRLSGRLHALNGGTRQKTEPVPGKPCKDCGLIALVRVDGKTVCTNCSTYSGQWADAMADAITKITDQQAV